MQLEDTDQHLSLKEFMGHSSITTSFDTMMYMPGEIILARMMTALDMEFKRALLPPCITRPVHVYSVFNRSLL